MKKLILNKPDSSERPSFAEIAEINFLFLISLGFKMTRCDATLLRFESPAVFVDIYYDPLSHHVGLDLGLLRESSAFSLHEVLTFLAPAELASARCQASNSEMLERCLSEIASLVDNQCQPLLRGDLAAFASLRSIVAPMRMRATLEAQFGAVIDRADRAWEAKDLQLAMALYEKAQPALDDIRVRRLAYLRNTK